MHSSFSFFEKEEKTYSFFGFSRRDKTDVDPQFCPPSTCSIKYLFGTLWQFPGGPLLLMKSIFSKPP